MASALRRLMLVPNMVRLRRELTRQTHALEEHRAIDPTSDSPECTGCGEPSPCPTQRSTESDLLRVEPNIRELGRKALS